MRLATLDCPNCGAKVRLSPTASHGTCEYCGSTAYRSAAVGAADQISKAFGQRNCPACAEPIAAEAKKCKHCGEWLGAGGPSPSMSLAPRGPQAMNPPFVGAQGPSKVLCGVLALVFPIGIHRFIMGYPGIGIAQFFTTTFLFFGVFWSWADAIMILTGNGRTADGRPLS